MRRSAETPHGTPGGEALIRGAPGPIALLEQDFTIVAVSEGFLRAFRTTREAVLGQSLFDVLAGNPDGQAGLRAWLDAVLAGRASDRLPAARCDVPRAAGEGGGLEERYWDLLSYPVRDEEGRITHLVLQAEDVTDRVRDRPPAADRAEADGLYQAVCDQGLFAGRLALDGTVTDANHSSLEPCGFTRDEVIGRPFWECGWWNRSAKVQAWVRAGFEQAVRGEPFRGVTPCFRADGSERLVDFACMPVKDDAGRLLFVVVTGLDITERSWSERDQRATEILESITDAFFALGRDWRFTYVNRQAERLLGRAPGELLGVVIWDAYPGILGSEFEAAYRRVASEGVAASFTSHDPDHDRWYEVHACPAPRGISVSFRDVTGLMREQAERDRLVAESDRQRRIYEAALSNTPDLVYVFDLDHRFTYANEALLRMWGRTREEALGKNCLELGYEPWHAERHDREIEQVVATRAPIRGEVPFTGTNGRRIYDYIFVPVIGAGGEVEAVAGTTRDVTERRRDEEAIRAQSERLRENDRLKDEFLAMLAHELRNPLSAIGNAVALSRRSPAKEHADWAAEVITRQVGHLSRLIDDLLDVSRITRGKIALRKETVDLAPILGSALESVRPLLEERKHRLLTDVAASGLWVRADPTRVEQCVGNLLTNAAKYTESGGTIRLSARGEGGEAVISVADDGIGIAPEQLPRMFELFAQGDRSLARSEGGLGIGLTVVKTLVELHGGRVSAHSAGPGSGSEFAIRLPLAEAPARAEAEARPDGQAEAGGRRSSRILIVDDSVDTARGLSRLLRLLGHDVRTAHDGREALEIAHEQRPEYILLDIGLPGMDGYQVAARLREDGCCRASVIVAVSGYGRAEDRRRSAEAGIDHHLVKPVDPDALIGLIARA